MREHRGDTPDEDRALGTIEEGVITRVERYEHDGDVRWDIGYGDCWGISLPDRGVEPKVGDTLTCFGSFGRPVHGHAINGQVLDYRTREQMDAEHQAWVEAHEAKQRAEFEANQAQLDADYECLPPLFKLRIDRFRAANPDFRWKYESYEMLVCTQAALLADWARQQADDSTPGWKERAVQIINDWNRINSAEHDPPYDYAAQKAMVPGWADGHSGNTHDCAVMLAKEALTVAERIPLHHGALSPLVGTADYSEADAP